MKTQAEYRVLVSELRKVAEKVVALIDETMKNPVIKEVLPAQFQSGEYLPATMDDLLAFVVTPIVQELGPVEFRRLWEEDKRMSTN